MTVEDLFPPGAVNIVRASACPVCGAQIGDPCKASGIELGPLHHWVRIKRSGAHRQVKERSRDGYGVVESEATKNRPGDCVNSPGAGNEGKVFDAR